MLMHPFLELLNLGLQQLVLLQHLIHLLHAVPLSQLLGCFNPQESIVACSLGLDLSPEHPRLHEEDEGADLENGDETSDATQGIHYGGTIAVVRCHKGVIQLEVEAQGVRRDGRVS